jgi:filamentous hemagglutinin
MIATAGLSKLVGPQIAAGLNKVDDGSKSLSKDAISIGNGHAFDKHVLERGEFPEITTKEQFQKHINNIISNPSEQKILSNGRSAYWDNNSGTVVIKNPNTTDGGTAFKPSGGKNYFDKLKN